MSNWVVRLHDPADRGEEEVVRVVTEALEAEGFRIMNVNPPMRLNPDPLKIRKTED
jgi:hypothetical protein